MSLGIACWLGLGCVNVAYCLVKVASRRSRRFESITELGRLCLGRVRWY